MMSFSEVINIATKKKKPTKTELFYTELRELIKKDIVYWEMDNYNDIEANVGNYLAAQQHFKKVGKRWSSELFHYIMAEGMLELIEKYLPRLKREEVINPFTYRNFEDFVMTKINDIGVFKMVYCGSDTTTNKFMRYNKEKIRDMFYNLDEETQKQAKLLKLMVARDELKKIVTYSPSIQNALDDTENEINSILEGE